ncbi:Amino acid permease domain containing protein [Elaphomyces granulatus]
MTTPSDDGGNHECAELCTDDAVANGNANHLLLISSSSSSVSSTSGSDMEAATSDVLLTDVQSDDAPSLAELSTSSNNSLEDLGPRNQSRKLTFLNGLALVVSLQIGSGIFSAPSQVSQHVSAPGVGIIVWVLGGVLVWTGVASFIELGLTITQNGGAQEYLRYCYGDLMGFLFTWTWVAISKPSSMAVISTVFANHFCHIFVHPRTVISPWLIKLVAIIGIAAITAVNCAGAKTGVKAANVFFVLKLTAVFSVALFGIGASLLGYGEGMRIGGHRWFDGDYVEPVGLWTQVGNTVTALFGALYCYGGWEAIGFVVGDMENARRDLRRVLNCALVIVIIAFTSMNTALYLILSIIVIRKEYTPVVEFGRYLFGFGGSLLYSLVIAMSAMGALNANVFATAILCVTASRRGYFPRIFANMHYARGTSESDYYRRVLRNWPAMIRNVIIGFATMTSTLRLERNVPM